MPFTAQLVFSLRYVILELYPFDLMEFVGYRTQGRGLGA
jgi:hypothetical protein